MIGHAHLPCVIFRGISIFCQVRPSPPMRRAEGGIGLDDLSAALLPYPVHCAGFLILETLGEMSTSESSNNGSQPGNQDTGYIPGDDTWTQWRNIFSILAGRMTDEGKEQFRVARDIRNEVADCKRCEDQRDYLLQFSESFPLCCSRMRRALSLTQDHS